MVLFCSDYDQVDIVISQRGTQTTANGDDETAQGIFKLIFYITCI